jgi:hypothetical protein
MQRKMKLGIVGTLLAVMIASVAYAWVASNTLHFNTTLAGSPFTLTILDSFTSRNVLSPPYLPGTLHYEEPVILYTNTKNWANSAYSDVKTNYKIWRTDGGAMDTSWVTVHVQDPINNFDLSFSLASDTSISGTANNVLVASIGPYTAVAHFTVDAMVTVTFHTSAPLMAYQADVWVSVPP